MRTTSRMSSRRTRSPRRDAASRRRCRPRGLARAAAGHHRSGRRQGPRRRRPRRARRRIPPNPGGFIVTVAIADVAAYVRPDSALDREAMKRGNSVYFPDRVVPMLPERISNDLCSLREDEDRPALAVRMIFAAAGRKMRPPLPPHHDALGGQALLRRGAAAFDGGRRRDRPAPRRAAGRSGTPTRCCARPRGARAAGARPARTQGRARQDGAIERIVVPERLESHRLIEEFMIQANVAAAETLEAKKSRCRAEAVQR